MSATLGAAGVGYLVSLNRHALPSHLAAGGRVVIVLALAGTGFYATRDPIRTRMGAWLLCASVFACLWLLNGSRDALPFTIGMLASGLAPTVVYSLLLAHPSGRMRSRATRRFVLASGGLAMASWMLLSFASPTPPLATPLMRCGHHCPHNLLYTGSIAPAGAPLRALVYAVWLAVPVGAFVDLSARFLRASGPARRMLAPVETAAAGGAILLVGFLSARAAGAGAESLLGTALLAAVLAVPLAILLGLHLERAYLGAAVVRLVERLPQLTRENVEGVLADALRDPSLRVLFRSASGWTDCCGRPVEIEHAGSDRGAAVIERSGMPAGTVLYDHELVDQGSFITAAGEAAMLALSRNELYERLHRDCDELAAVRRRALDAALYERQRITRNLHDGAQQRLLAIRMKLAEAQRRGIGAADVASLVAELHRDLDAALSDMRTLAQSDYPPVLVDYGLGRALAAACEGYPRSTVLHLKGIGRYSADVEAAVYFTCVEALQNAAKHAESHTPPSVHLEDDGGLLLFEITDAGAGFELQKAQLGTGILSMRERIEAVGGVLAVATAPGRGTVVSGSVPVGPAAAGATSQQRALSGGRVHR